MCEKTSSVYRKEELPFHFPLLVLWVDEGDWKTAQVCLMGWYSSYLMHLSAVLRVSQHDVSSDPGGRRWGRKEVGVWRKEVGVWRKEVEVWRKEVGVWRKEVGVWRKEVGVWRLGMESNYSAVD